MNCPELFHLPPESFAALPGLEELLPLAEGRFKAGSTPLSFEASLRTNGFRLNRGAEGGVRIAYRRPCDAYRALAHLLAGLLPEAGEFTQESPFESLGVMLDVSRNAVLRPESLERLFRHFALMGINSVQLYMEDVYCLPGEPFFGYGRGAYTPEELRRIDDCGARLGIEVIPCIQTLGHLEQILQWPAYAGLVDVPGVLLVGDEATYRLTAKMLDTVASCFRTRRVHIGMDEAHGVGQGKYRKLHGEERPFDVLNRHLKRVTAQCVERGLKPMIWSDMYFRLGSEINHYYDRESRISQDVIDGISREIDFVYWDYYHTDQAFYEEWIDRHRAMGKEPLFASGAWTWSRFWTLMGHTVETNQAGMRAARRKGLREAFITVWGDDGAEVHPFSILPAIQVFAELAHTEAPEPERLEALFSVTCGASYHGCVEASELDLRPASGDEEGVTNFSKWLLWHDPVFNFLKEHIPAGLPARYEALAEKLEPLPAEPFAFPALLAKVLAGKTRLHLEAREAYRRGDAEAVRALLPVVDETRAGLGRLWKLHAAVWREWHKPFGWEVIDSRYAGAASRLERLREILAAWVEAPGSRVEEFEFETAPLTPGEGPRKGYFPAGRAISASHLRW